MSRRTRRRGSTFLLIGVLFSAALWLYNTATSSPASDTTDLPPATSGALPARIHALPATTPGQQAALASAYDRDRQFGSGWLDPDRNGCDAREDILIRDHDGGHPDRKDPCRIVGLVLHDPYTGVTLHGSRSVQIDHIVPLAVAWRSGAATWTGEQRRRFANDPANLLAVHGPTNQAKSDHTPDEWMPPNRATHCDYIDRYVLVSATYQLAVTDATRAALLKTAATC